MTLKNAMVAGLHELGLFALTRRLYRRHFLGATVLLYHRVLPRGTSPHHYAALMGEPTADQLETLIRYLKQRFRFSSPQECVERWGRGLELEPYTLLLTFDDGYADLYENLLPVLVECAVPATAFVTTAAIGGRATWFQRFFAALHGTNRMEQPSFESLSPMPLETPAQRVAAIEAVSAVQRRHPAAVWEGMINRLCDHLGWDGELNGQRMLNWEQVAALLRSGWVTIGGHTDTHPCLENCEPSQLTQELFDSAAELRSRLPEVSFLPFSYPHGRCPPLAIQEMVREAGYGCAFTGRRAANTRRTPLYQLGRQHLPPEALARASLSLSGLSGMSESVIPSDDGMVPCATHPQ